MRTQWLALSILSVMLSFSLVTAGGEKEAEEYYRRAQDIYYTLKTSAEKRSQRVEWLKCIRALQLVWKHYPQTPEGQRALFLIGKLARDLYLLFHQPEDLRMAVQAYQQVVDHYSTSRLADDAQFFLGEIAFHQGNFTQAKEAYETVVQNYPASDTAEKASRRLRELTSAHPKKGNKGNRQRSAVQETAQNGRLPMVQTVRHWSNPRYTRIVVDVDGKVNFQESRLTKPDRLYLNLSPARINQSLAPASLAIANGQLKGIRMAQYQPDVVRVVLDIERIVHYKVFTLDDPFRVVIDMLGPEREKAGISFSSREGFSARKGNGIPAPLSLVQQLGLGIGTVVIDPGHGGKDPGAIGPSGVMEKDVVLDIGLKLRKLIERELGWKVVMTREKDVFIPLEERTALANSHDADLFLSIHVNATPREQSRGIETYFLDLATSPEAMETAARENMTSVRRISDLQLILKDLLLNTKRNESSRLAGAVQVSLVSYLGKHYSRVENRGVKQAPFYVLLGAEMPSILIETAFISNRLDERNLKNASYRLALARGILEGLKGYADKARSLVSWQGQEAESR